MLAVVGLVSTVMILYARERVQTIMAQAFFHSYIAGESAQNVQVRFLFCFEGLGGTGGGWGVGRDGGCVCV